ncbi:MAG: BA14K family protein [Rhizobiaceae bacterium]|nr:BA14K family protein [Rhizobiaceae bacterium]MCV0406279.1 BA14K family protein [Rhizobiaceae bacterium]
MLRILSSFAIAAVVGLTGLFSTPAPVLAQSAVVQLVGHRDYGPRRHYDDARRHYHWREHGRRHWHRPAYRHYRRHYPRPYVEFHFGTPHYVRPRYARPSYVRPAMRFSPAHYRWCEARYRSYRTWDNSWQPYHGPRRQCISPYG